MLVNINLAEKEMEARMKDSLYKLEQKQLMQDAKGNNASAVRGLLNSIAAGLGHLVERVWNSAQSWFVKPVEERWNR